ENENGFQVTHLRAVTNVLPWLAYRLPVASPLRAQLPVALAAARARAEHPDIYSRLGWTHRGKKLMDLFHAAPEPQAHRLDIDGWLTFLIDDRDNFTAYLRWSQYRAEHEDLVRAVKSMLDSSGDNVIRPLTVLRSSTLAEACALTPATGVEGYYQDPTV